MVQIEASLFPLLPSKIPSPISNGGKRDGKRVTEIPKLPLSTIFTLKLPMGMEGDLESTNGRSVAVPTEPRGAQTHEDCYVVWLEPMCERVFLVTTIHTHTRTVKRGNNAPTRTPIL